MAETVNVVPTELGTEKVGKLFKKYAVPAIVAMVAASLYNMVDSIFIGQGLGPLAISGLAVTFPLMNLSTAFGTLVGIGASTLLSIFLGQKNYEAANKVLSNIVSLNIIIGCLVAVLALLFLDPILYFFGASENTIGYAREYMIIILAGNAFSHLYFGLNAALRSSGSPKFAMGLTIFTVVFNTILDPIFIFVFKLGIAGAAWATIIAQLVALIFSIRKFSHFDTVMHFMPGILRLDKRIAKDSLSIGTGPFLMNSAACLVSLFINQQFARYSGDLGIGAFGIVNRVTFIFIMICIGFNQGMQPIASYNFGSRQYTRVKQVYKIACIAATIVLVFGLLVSDVFTRFAVGIFTSDPELGAKACHGLRLMNILFPIIGFQIITTNLFQCMGMVNRSVFLSLSRQLLFLLPSLYLLPLWLGEDGIWLSYPVSDFIATITTAVLAIDLMRKLNRLQDGDSPEILGGPGSKIGVTR